MLILDLLYFLLLLLCLAFLAQICPEKILSPPAAKTGCGRNWTRPATEKAIWIHAVSVGEVRSLKSLIQH